MILLIGTNVHPFQVDLSLGTAASRLTIKSGDSVSERAGCCLGFATMNGGCIDPGFALGILRSSQDHHISQCYDKWKHYWNKCNLPLRLFWRKCYLIGNMISDVLKGISLFTSMIEKGLVFTVCKNQSIWKGALTNW